jgi:Na+/proline symporter
VLVQVIRVGAYFALVVILYWRGLTDAGAVGIILGLALSFLGVGLGAWIDLAKAIETGLVQGNIPTAVIHDPRWQ